MARHTEFGLVLSTPLLRTADMACEVNFGDHALGPGPQRARHPYRSTIHPDGGEEITFSFHGRDFRLLDRHLRTAERILTCIVTVLSSSRHEATASHPSWCGPRNHAELTAPLLVATARGYRAVRRSLHRAPAPNSGHDQRRRTLYGAFLRQTEGFFATRSRRVQHAATTCPQRTRLRRRPPRRPDTVVGDQQQVDAGLLYAGILRGREDYADRAKQFMDRLQFVASLDHDPHSSAHLRGRHWQRGGHARSLSS